MGGYVPMMSSSSGIRLMMSWPFGPSTSRMSSRQRLTEVWIMSCHGACRWAADRLQVVWLREALQHCSCSSPAEALCPWYARPSHGITHRLPSLKHLLCQTDTCPAHATDIVHMAGVREPREVGKPAWGSAAPQGADDKR